MVSGLTPNINYMISIGELIYRLQENTLLRAVSKSDIINHVKDCISLIGAPGLFEEKKITLLINDYRAQLPPDFVKRVSVHRVVEDALGFTQMNIILGHNSDDNSLTYNDIKDADGHVDLLYTHKVVGNFIYTDFPEGKIVLIYNGFLVDEQGLPLINAGVATRLALEWYVKKKYYTAAWELGQLPDKVLQHTEQQYSWAIGRAHSEINIPDPVEAEAIGNMLVRLIPNTENFETGYKYAGQKERIRNQPPYR